MSELIDREATVKQICKMGEMLGNYHDRDVTIAIALFVQDDKSAFPTVERPHGEWKEMWHSGKDVYSCSECFEAYKMPIQHSFCPNCGADMRKESEAE